MAKLDDKSKNEIIRAMNKPQKEASLMNNQGYNPGMSEKAWLKLHVLAARLHIKYADKLAELRKEKENGKSA